MRRAVPFLLAAISLVFGGATTAWLSSEARASVAQLLLEQVRGAGAVVQALEPGALAEPSTLQRLRAGGDFDEVSLVDDARQVLADGQGRPPHRVDLLRLDAARLEAALHGASAVSLDYELGGLPFAVGYFPVPGAPRVLVVEAGSRFAEPARRVERARTAAFASVLVAAVALFLLALAWSRLEARWRVAATQAAFAQALQRFAAMAAHEIRNPLATIRGLMELYRERRGEALGEDGGRVVADVLGEVERLSRVTGDLLDLSSERPLDTSPHPVERLLAAAAASVQATFPALVVRCPDSNTLAEVDAVRLGQVLHNLLRNAAQARATTVTVEVHDESPLLRVRLHDDGPGVPEAQRDQLFQPFASQKSEGHGLGLALSRRLVERMGGSLTFVPTARGACFEVRLPRALAVG